MINSTQLFLDLQQFKACDFLQVAARRQHQMVSAYLADGQLFLLSSTELLGHRRLSTTHLGSMPTFGSH